ncbi:MAG: hypothetical protein KDB03_08165 [Planctomycetales bacterium]|nr:hypothetical protein [Planctomycetales bacterium]
MKDLTTIADGLEALAQALGKLDSSFANHVLSVGKRILASVKSFLASEITPRCFEKCERRIERLFREMARLLLERTVNQIEPSTKPNPVKWEDRVFHPYARRERSMATRVGTIRYCRWLYQNEYSFFVRGIAPLDKRLGLTGNRVSPGVAHKLGRLAADMPQQVVIKELQEQFGINLSVDSYPRVVEHLAVEIRYRHDEAALEQLCQWVAQAAKTKGKHSVLLLVGRDGVHVPMRESWKEAACATLAVYDKKRKRLGTIYLGQMPEEKQKTMTKRLTKVITGVLNHDCSKSLRLRYVTDAGSVPRTYFENVLRKLKDPRSGKTLNWTWGVDFFHACEYLNQLANSLYGTGTSKSQAWYRQQRHILRHDPDGVRKVLTSAAQIRRRHALEGTADDYDQARGYLDRFRSHMDYAARRKSGDPIGSGVTEAGCKVIFNQRMKQSGMRWSKGGGQHIVDLRTACRSHLWNRIWSLGLDDYTTLPETNSTNNQQLTQKSSKAA